MTTTHLLTFRLQVLGAPSLKDGAGLTPPALGWGKPLALLCLLAIRREVRRDEVVDLLWRDVEEGRARNAFRQALHRLRGAIGDDLLPQDRERLRLVRSDRLVVDLDLFDAAVNGGRTDEALELYAGDFLDHATLGEPPFDMWVEQERTRLRARFKQVLQDAVAQASGAGRWMEAIARSRRLLALAPFESGAAQLAATTLVSAGRRTEARDLLRQFGANLHAELGLPLPAELDTLLARIERQHERPQPVVSSAPASAGIDLSLPFVGREAELSQLLTLCRSTREDAGALALVEGGEGLGKSRLARELAAHAKSLGRITILTGRERAAGPQLPYGIFAEALRPLVHASGVVGAGRHLLAEAARLLPELRDELDLPAVTDVEDEAARLRFFEGIAALIDAAAFEQPILLVLEDLHFVPPSSLELLSYLSVRLAGSAVTFLITVRPAEASAATIARLRALGGSMSPHEGRALTFVLVPLAPGDVRQAVGAIAGRFAIPAAVADRVVQRAEGSPARLLELLRRAVAGENIATLPVSMNELLSERQQRLSSGQRRILLVIAMLGRAISPRFAAAAAHVPDSAARESLDVLSREGLIERAADGTVSTTDLAAAIAVDGAGEASRAFLSGWIADALAREPDASFAELARFYAVAGQARPAFEHARRAAFEALAMGAVPEAVQFFQSARTFAATPEQRSEIEGFLTTLGSGRRQLAASAKETPAAAPGSSRTGPTPVSETPMPAPASWVERLFPNWRILLAAAVVTLVISTAVLALRPAPLQLARGQPGDTLVVADGESGRAVRYVTGSVASGFAISERVVAPPGDPPWIDSLARPWANAIGAPRGMRVAVAKVTPVGSDLYVISADRSDTVALAVGEGDARPLGWSPDGRWVLAAVGRASGDERFDTDLYAYAVDGLAVTRRPVDTTARRAVTEAVWSPDGSRIAWVARAGAERQLEVFASDADASSVQNVSRHPADDHHIAWSGDGELLAFTSTRDGNSELYAWSFRENRLWRLTFDPAQDDGGVFSRDRRLIAFESTRGGAAGVYVMPALGGEAHRIGQSLSLSVVKWRGGTPRYVERVRMSLASDVEPGDTATLRLAAMDQFGDSMPVRDVQWSVLDSSLIHAIVPENGGAGELRLVARRAGLARVVGSVGRWRSDTAFVRIGSTPVPLLASGGDAFRLWRPLGVPAPARHGESAIVLNADREWDSGILSRAAVPLLAGLTVSATLDLPLATARDPATNVSVSLVAPEDTDAIDATAPQFLRHASFSWNADARRFVYAVGREIFTESVPAVGTESPLTIRLRVERDSTVSFSVAGQQRWRSTLRIIGPRQDSRVQAWIAGRATGDRVRVSRVSVLLEAPVTGGQPVAQ